MASPTLPYLYAILGFAAAGYIVWRGCSCWRQFLPLYVYTAACLSMGAVSWLLLVIVGYTEGFVTFYYGWKWAKAALECWILWEVYCQVRGTDDRLLWLTRSAQGFLVSVEAFRIGLHSPPEKMALLALAQWFFVLLILAQMFVREGHRGLRPGWGGIFFGAALLVRWKLDVYGLRVAAPNSEEWRALVQPMELAPWLVWVFAMRRAAAANSGRKRLLNRLRGLRIQAGMGAVADRSSFPTASARW